MKIFRIAKDGGPESTVLGYWLLEVKSLISIALLRFADGSRDAYHSHAFDSLNWVLRGEVEEQHIDGRVIRHKPGLLPVITRRSTFHKVVSRGTTWVFSLRGPWARNWEEYDPSNKQYSTLTHGRRRVA